MADAGASQAGSAFSVGGSRAGSAGDGGTSLAGTGGGTTAGAGGAAGGAALVGLGSITYERWNNLKGESVELVPVNQPPDFTTQLTSFQVPIDVSEDYAARVRGFLTAPATGQYVFFIRSDDNSELSLSTDDTPANKIRIAHIAGSPAWTGYEEWDKFPSQKSAPVELVAGKRYYIEALLKEDITEDHLSVGWLKPGDVGAVPSEIIPGKQLSPAN